MKKRRKRIDKENFLLSQYSKSFGFICESRNFIYSIIGIFFAFSIFSFLVPPPDYIFEQIIEFIKELLEKTKDMNQFELINFIFFNNLQSSFFGMLFGIFLGVPSLIVTVVNGYLLGFVANIAVNAEGFSSLLRLFPHGIFELPAVFVSLGLGLKIGSFVFREKKIKSLKNFLSNSFRVFVFVVIPLLLIAAIIEGSFIYWFR